MQGFETYVAKFKTYVARFETYVAEFEMYVERSEMYVAKFETDVARPEINVAKLETYVPRSQSYVAILKSSVASFKTNARRFAIKVATFAMDAGCHTLATANVCAAVKTLIACRQRVAPGTTLTTRSWPGPHHKLESGLAEASIHLDAQRPFSEHHLRSPHRRGQPRYLAGDR